MIVLSTWSQHSSSGVTNSGVMVGALTWQVQVALGASEARVPGGKAGCSLCRCAGVTDSCLFVL